MLELAVAIVLIMIGRATPSRHNIFKTLCYLLGALIILTVLPDILLYIKGVILR